MKNLIETSSLCKHYVLGSNLIVALDEVIVSVQHGEFIAVMGRSGSGKSTLMNQLGCLDTPTMGSYHFDGVDVSSLDSDALARFRNDKIGFCFQSYNLLPRASALANVALPLIYQGVSRRLRRDRAAAVLERVGLADRMDHVPSQLSGGQQQRVSIARALVTEPLLILADEPTGTLDSQTGEDILSVFTELNEAGITIVLVTHDELVAEYAHRMLLLRDGRVVDDRRRTPMPAVRSAELRRTTAA